jgi:molecular chaperone GrpE
LTTLHLRQNLQNMTNEKDNLTQAEGQTETTDYGIDINMDDNVAGTSHLNEQVEEESAFEKLKAEIDEQKDKYLRLFAEFDNYKKRNAKERLELMQTAGKEVILSMLEVMDDCDRAEKQMSTTDNVQQVKDGVQLVFNKLRNNLKAKGLKPMETVGKDFDVELHEAITKIPVPDMHDKVVDEIEKGYYLNEKIIRFAKVVVGE